MRRVRDAEEGFDRARAEAKRMSIRVTELEGMEERVREMGRRMREAEEQAESARSEERRLGMRVKDAEGMERRLMDVVKRMKEEEKRADEATAEARRQAATIKDLERSVKDKERVLARLESGKWSSRVAAVARRGWEWRQVVLTVVWMCVIGCGLGPEVEENRRRRSEEERDYEQENIRRYGRRSWWIAWDWRIATLTDVAPPCT